MPLVPTLVFSNLAVDELKLDFCLFVSYKYTYHFRLLYTLPLTLAVSLPAVGPSAHHESHQIHLACTEPAQMITSIPTPRPPSPPLPWLRACHCDASLLQHTTSLQDQPAPPPSPMLQQINAKPWNQGDFEASAQEWRAFRTMKPLSITGCHHWPLPASAVPRLGAQQRIAPLALQNCHSGCMGWILAP